MSDSTLCDRFLTLPDSLSQFEGMNVAVILFRVDSLGGGLSQIPASLRVRRRYNLPLIDFWRMFGQIKLLASYELRCWAAEADGWEGPVQVRVFWDVHCIR